MKLRWYGHSCFEITLSDDRRVITDPFDASVGYECPRARADIVTVSHAHFDHSCVDYLTEPKRVINHAGAHDLGGVIITGIQSAHDDAGGAKRGGNLLFKIEAEGMSIVHLGDLGHLPTPEQYAFIERADVMLIPVGGYYTIDTNQALEIVKRARPALVIPMHFKTPAISFPISDETAFAAALGAARARDSVIELTPALSGALVMTY